MLVSVSELVLFLLLTCPATDMNTHSESVPTSPIFLLFALTTVTRLLHARLDSVSYFDEQCTALAYTF